MLTEPRQQRISELSIITGPCDLKDRDAGVDEAKEKSDPEKRETTEED